MLSHLLGSFLQGTSRVRWPTTGWAVIAITTIHSARSKLIAHRAESDERCIPITDSEDGPRAVQRYRKDSERQIKESDKEASIAN